VKICSQLTASVTFFIATLASNASAAVLTTLPSWDGSFHITALSAQSSTYGQTFRSPEAARLDEWSFFGRDSSIPGEQNLVFDAILARWSGDRAVGPAIFESRGLVLPDSDRGQFYEVTLNVGGVALDAGTQYVMFLNTSAYPTTGGQKLDLGATPESYSDGAFWYQLSYNLQGNVYNFPWTCADEGHGCRYGDAAFRAITSPVPEPSSIALAIAALSVLALVRRTRQD
jgi:hypothetical protein